MVPRPVILLLVSIALATPLYSQGVFAKAGANTAADAAAAVATLIAQYPQGGPELTAAIATRIAEHPDDAAVIIAAAQSASPEVVGALAAGLAQGAASLVTTNPAAVAAIRAAVWQSGNRNFATAFALAYAAAAETPIALAEQRELMPFSQILRGPVVSPN